MVALTMPSSVAHTADPAALAQRAQDQDMAQPAARRHRLWRDGVIRLALIGIAVVLVWRLSDVLLLLFAAALIASVLRGLADWLAAKLHAPRQLMLAAVALSLTALVVAAAYWIGPALVGQANDLVNRLTTQLHNMQGHFGGSPVGRVAKHLTSATGLGNGMMGYMYSFATTTLGTIGSLFVVIVVSLYLAIAPDLYVNGIVRLTPQPHRRLMREVLREIGHNLQLWSLGQLADMVTVGALSAIGLYLLGVPVPFALATLAGLLTIVPYFGALAAGVPGVLVALTHSWVSALWVVVIFTICHVVEGYLMAPIVQRHMVRLPPAIAIISMTLAAVLFGPLGIILGTPLAVAVMVAVRRVYVEHILGDRIDAELTGA